MDEAIRYRIEPAGRRIGRAGAVPCEPALLAGPTCDSADVLYTTTPYMLPADLAAGDLLDIHAAGAYTATYSTVGSTGSNRPPSTCCRSEWPGDHGAAPPWCGAGRGGARLLPLRRAR